MYNECNGTQINFRKSPKIKKRNYVISLVHVKGVDKMKERNERVQYKTITQLTEIAEWPESSSAHVRTSHDEFRPR